MESERRFSEKEVALVLRHASEMEAQTSGAGAGLSLRELEDIAAEVGIAPELVRRAVADLDRGPRRNPLAGAASHEVIRAVPGELGREEMARLIQLVDRKSDLVGEVSEALGTTRWTARDRFRATQVAITSAKGETTVRVVERATSRLRRALHAAPTVSGAALAVGVFGQLSPSGAAAAGLAALGAALGALAGRLLWGRLSRDRAARVDRLAAELAGEAAASGGTGGENGK